MEQSASQFKIYRQTMLDRQFLRTAAVADRVNNAWAVANKAAKFLKDTYPVSDVWLFGSLAEGKRFSMTSDIDLAISHLSPDDYLSAVAELQDISHRFKIDLIQIDRIPSAFKTAILVKGKPL